MNDKIGSIGVGEKIWRYKQSWIIALEMSR